MKAGGEGDKGRWDGWMASLTWWTWVWESSRSWWRTGKPGMLQSMESQRVGHDWTEYAFKFPPCHLLKDILVTSEFWQLSSCYKRLCAGILSGHSASYSKYQGMQLLDYIVRIGLVRLETAKLFFQNDWTILHSCCHDWEFMMPHILARTFCCQYSVY